MARIFSTAIVTLVPPKTLDRPSGKGKALGGLPSAQEPRELMGSRQLVLGIKSDLVLFAGGC